MGKPRTSLVKRGKCRATTKSGLESIEKRAGREEAMVCVIKAVTKNKRKENFTFRSIANFSWTWSRSVRKPRGQLPGNRFWIKGCDENEWSEVHIVQPVHRTGCYSGTKPGQKLLPLFLSSASSSIILRVNSYSGEYNMDQSETRSSRHERSRHERSPNSASCHTWLER